MIFLIKITQEHEFPLLFLKQTSTGSNSYSTEVLRGKVTRLFLGERKKLSVFGQTRTVVDVKLAQY